MAQSYSFTTLLIAEHSTDRNQICQSQSKNTAGDRGSRGEVKGWPMRLWGADILIQEDAPSVTADSTVWQHRLKDAVNLQSSGDNINDWVLMVSDALVPDALTLADIAFRCQHNVHDRNLRLFLDEAVRSLFPYFASVPAVLASVEPCSVTFVTFDLSQLMSPALSSCFSLGLRCISTLSQLTRMAASAFAIKNNAWWMRNWQPLWLYYSKHICIPLNVILLNIHFLQQRVCRTYDNYQVVFSVSSLFVRAGGLRFSLLFWRGA